MCLPAIEHSVHFTNGDKMSLLHVCVLSHSVVSDFFVTPWSVACQSPLSMCPAI